MTGERRPLYTEAERQERREFLEARQQSGIGASSLPQILGGHAMEVYHSYTRPITDADVDSGETSINLFRGHVLEPIAIEFFFRLTGYVGRRERRQFTHPDYPGASVSADGTVFEGSDWGTGTLEAKAPGWRVFRNLVDVGTSEAIILQVQSACAVRRVDWGALIFATLEHHAGPIIPVEIQYQPDLGEFLLETASTFWTRHVVTRTPPDPAEWARLLDKMPRIRNRPRWEKNDQLHQLDDDEAVELIRQRCEIDTMLRMGEDAKDDVTEAITGLLLQRYPGIDKFEAASVAKVTRVRSKTAGGFDRHLLASHRPIDRDALVRRIMEGGSTAEQAEAFIRGLDLDLAAFQRPGREYDYLRFYPTRIKEEG